MSDIVFIKSNLKALSISGLWDYWNLTSPIKIKVFKYYGIIISLYYMCHFVTVFTEMVSVITDIPMFMENATITLLSCMTLVKNGTLLFRKKKLEHILNEMRQAEKLSLKKNKRQVEIFYDSANQAKLFSRAYWIMCFLMLVGFLVERPMEYVLMGPEEMYHYKVRMLFSAWFPFDEFQYMKYFLAYGFQISIGCLGDYFIAVTDSFFIALMIFSIGQFKIIQDEIRNLDEFESHNEDLLYDFYDEVKNIVVHHCKIIS